MKRRLYIELGRAGDILNILPLCHRDFAESGGRPLLMVAKPFVPMLEGVSYVEPVSFDGDFREIGRACAEGDRLAAAQGLEVVCTQIYGEGLTTPEDCWSFMRESWNRVPNAPAWGSLPLVFDRRDPAREAAVRQQLFKAFEHPEWPYVVVATEGTSSPFPDADELKLRLRSAAKARGMNMVDLGGFMAPRFFDLLGLLEGAASLLTIDTGLLHLAHALPRLPVIALVTREPDMWHGSPWRPQHVSRFFYDSFPEAIPAAIAATLSPAVRTPTIAHLWCDWRKAKAPYHARRRMALARVTWEAEYKAAGNWRECEFAEADAYRDARDIGDPIAMPYIHDMVEHVLAKAHEGIVALTNADVCFTPGITGMILDRVTDETAAFTHRFDFDWLREPILYESQVRRGKWIAGSDAFFFTPTWWRNHRGEFGDFILGRERWDEVFRQLIKRHGGRQIPAAIYHEAHESYWLRDRGGLAGNRHNLRLGNKWFLRSGFDGFDPYWWKLPGTDGP